MLETITTLLTTYQIPSVFVGAFFFGDSVILTSSYLAGQLQWSPVPIFLAALAGTVLSDTMWFLGGRFFANRLIKVRFFQHERAKMSGFIARLVGKRPLAALIMVKFLYGSRIAMILYSASSGISFWLFSLFNGIGTIIWLLVFIPLGYLAGQGVSQTAPFLHALPSALAVLVISIIIFRIITIWMERTKSLQ